MSASTSSNEAEFFRRVEELSDSFDAARVREYELMMREWIPAAPAVEPVIPAQIETVYVISRVTLGADIKITSIVLDAMKRRFEHARVVLVGNRKSAELFEADSRIEHLEAAYPRSGPVAHRVEFGHSLRRTLEGPARIVVDPDSRISQLGLIPLCEPEHFFHFPSRTAGGDTSDNLIDLTRNWLRQTFGVSGTAYVAPKKIDVEGERPWAAISLGVGDNETKRIGGDFEARLIASLANRHGTLWIDRGAGGEEARRVTCAVEASGASSRVRFWEASFAGFVSIVAQSDLYVGYDSAGQHAAAAAGTPLISIFAGAPSQRFRDRWKPSAACFETPLSA